MKLNDSCANCGKSREEADSNILQTQIGIGIGEGAWVCEDCFKKKK